MKTLFVDTNILLHFRRLDEIDWLALTDNDQVQIVLCGTVIRELDKQKAIHPQERIRKRARDITSWLHKIAFGTAVSELRRGVGLQFEVREPDINLWAGQLRAEISDDWIIASVLAWKVERGGEVVLIVTADLGMSMKAKLHGIPVLIPSESDRLPDVIDEEGRKIRKLEQELQELRNSHPKLAIVFGDGERLSKHVIKPYEEVDLRHVDVVVAKLREKYPRLEKGNGGRQEPRRSPRTTLDIADAYKGLELSSLALRAMCSPEEVKAYNDELDAFFDRYRQYAAASQRYGNRQQRSIFFGIVLENHGTRPGEDIDIHLHFPDGFELFEEDDVESPPEPPSPPRRPDRIGSLGFDLSRLSSGMVHPPSPILPHIDPSPNVSAPSIRRTNSYDVDISVQTAKHGYTYQLGCYRVIFDSPDSVTSFQIDYEISAANLPKPTAGQLSVVVSSE